MWGQFWMMEWRLPLSEYERYMPGVGQKGTIAMARQDRLTLRLGVEF